jgi:hypothetical protein
MANAVKNLKSKESNTEDSYSLFDKIDGTHRLKKLVPECYIDYQARLREGAKVVYFNFELAREMGLIESGHANRLSKQLSKKITDTFGLIIINEFDIENNIKYDEQTIKPGKYMATRYLQLQHPDNLGKNSGDGRSIWYGEVKHKGKIWDLSGCGTGATRLSPATSIHQRYFQNGDPTISYGCGYSEVDEGLSTLFFSEIFNKNGLSTERVLAIIQYADGYSTTVRAHDNLLRPSHFFNHIKQGNRDVLSRLLDYYIDRELKNKKMQQSTIDKRGRYQAFLEYYCENVAKVAARFEDDYIFCWMDWDGDNILMDGGIIDYGSIRQFGLFHHEYRYDDVERYSTTIVEQKEKVKYMLQTFVQIVDFVITGDKKPITHFKNNEMLIKFDKLFESNKDINLLTKIGFEQIYVNFLYQNHAGLVESFRKAFSYFERSKSKQGVVEVADGITWNAIFCMRDVLRELPQLILSRNELLSSEELINIMASSYALEEDLELTSYRDRKCKEFQTYYLNLIQAISKRFKKKENDILLEIVMRSSVINRYDRVTGDSITHIVDKTLKELSNITNEELYSVVDVFSLSQRCSLHTKEKIMEKTSKKHKLVNQFIDIVKECREGI